MRWLGRPAAALQQARTSFLATNGSDVFTPGFRARLPTSIDELAWEHPLLLAIDGLPIDPNVKRHSPRQAELAVVLRPAADGALA